MTFDYGDQAGNTVSEKLGYDVSLITDQEDKRFYHQLAPLIYDFFDHWNAKPMSGSVDAKEIAQIKEKLKKLHGYFETYGRLARQFNRDSFHSSLSPGNLNFIAAEGLEIHNLQDLDFSLPHSLYAEADRFGFFVNDFVQQPGCK